MIRRAVLFALACVALVLPASRAQAQAQTGFGGDWNITLNTPQGNQDLTLSLTQVGDKVAGDLASPMGSLPVTGAIVAGELQIKGSIEAMGLDLLVSTKVLGDVLTGTIKFGNFGEYAFAGNRVKKAAAASAPAPATATPAAASAGASAGSGTVAGAWNVQLHMGPAGDFPVAVTLKQEADRVTGTLSAMGMEIPVTGTVTGATLTLHFTAQTPNGSLPITLTGALSATGLAGTASIEGLGDAPWSATRAVQQ